MKVVQKQANNDSNRSVTEATQSSWQNQSAQVINNSKEAIAQRAFIANINDSPRMLAQRRQIESYIEQTSASVHPASSINQQPIQRLEKPDDEEKKPLQRKFASESQAQLKESVPRVESADVLQKMAEDIINNDVPASQEEDIENHAPELVEPDIEDMTIAQEEAGLSSANDGAVTQTKVAQLARSPSNRIASYRQEQARRDRRNRMGRHRAIVRLVPGAAIQTRLAPIAALGGNGLLCPIGSYIQRINNFNYTGSRAGDAAALGGTPPGQVWHHYHDFVSTGPNAGHSTMYLLQIAQHRPGHLGGVYQWNHTAGNGVYG